MNRKTLALVSLTLCLVLLAACGARAIESVPSGSPAPAGESERIKELLTEYFEIYAEQRTHPESADYDYSEFHDPYTSHAEDIAYAENSNTYYKEKRRTGGVGDSERYSSDVNFEEIEIAGSIAYVTAYWTLSEPDAPEDEPDLAGSRYCITMTNRSGEWYISNIYYSSEAGETNAEVLAYIARMRGEKAGSAVSAKLYDPGEVSSARMIPVGVYSDPLCNTAQTFGKYKCVFTPEELESLAGVYRGIEVIEAGTELPRESKVVYSVDLYGGGTVSWSLWETENEAYVMTFVDYERTVYRVLSDSVDRKTLDAVFATRNVPERDEQDIASALAAARTMLEEIEGSAIERLWFDPALDVCLTERGLYLSGFDDNGLQYAPEDCVSILYSGPWLMKEYDWKRDADSFYYWEDTSGAYQVLYFVRDGEDSDWRYLSGGWEASENTFLAGYTDEAGVVEG